MAEVLEHIKVWLKHIFDPHCELCEDDKICHSCEYLKRQIQIEKDEKRVLLDMIAKLSTPAEVNESESNYDPRQVQPRFVPWRVKRAQMERLHRVPKVNAAEEQAKKELDVELGEDLDSVLGVK